MRGKLRTQEYSYKEQVPRQKNKIKKKCRRTRRTRRRKKKKSQQIKKKKKKQTKEPEDHEEARTIRRSNSVCCLTSTETARTIRDGEPRTAISTFTQLLIADDQTKASGYVQWHRNLRYITAVNRTYTTS